ncbi:MAG: hypothetical protein HFE77_01125 [Clostridiales bacterium]|nr:hypothetical protein [Clostridiales bacterium]
MSPTISVTLPFRMQRRNNMNKVSALFKNLCQKAAKLKDLPKKQQIVLCCLAAAILLTVTACILFICHVNRSMNASSPTEDASETQPNDEATGPLNGETDPSDDEAATNAANQGIVFSKLKATMKPGEELTLTVESSLPEKPTELVWSSSNEAVAKVDQKGTVKAVSAGTARIMATTKDKAYQAVCQITVEGTTGSNNIGQPQNPATVPPSSGTGTPLPGVVDTPEPTVPNDNLSAKPTVTVATQVAAGIYIVAGTCTADTEYIKVSGEHVTTVYLYPDYGVNSAYFIGQVKISAATNLSIQGKESGKELSQAIVKPAANHNMPNKMTSGEYMPVFGKNSRMYFYSSLLSYSLSDVVNSSIRTRAAENLTRHCNTVKEANPEAELVYLVIPSSAAVYPETIPEGFEKASGETLYQAFSSLASNAGATVIYPLSTFNAHKNDGKGYKIYHNTDSHWSTYGAYWGVSELMNHISKKYPSAAPRAVGDMGFYTKELWGGDALFSFGDNSGFENPSRTGVSGQTAITKISELTTLYTRTMPTATIQSVYRGNKSVYVNGDFNSGRATVSNPNGAGLPSALILRDSFSVPAYDMVNDRFSTVYWQPSHDYTFPTDAILSARPDYVIYIVAEQNLLKVMLENANINLTQYVR